jgi:hypothetical protein
MTAGDVMRIRIVFTLALTSCVAGLSARAAEDPSSATDLKATIALHGMACDQVVNVKRLGDSDYLASCQDGNRYHVFVNAQGRVVVEKQ